MTAPKTPPEPDKRLAAVCGLFCPACSIYIGTREDPARLKLIADRFGIPVEEARCDGCRSDRRFPYCATCKMEKCAAEKGLDFCGACEEFPCPDLKAFQEELPHRIELWENLGRIDEAGWEKWFEEMAAHYACPECGTLNTAYDRACRECGAGPSCAYVRKNTDELTRLLQNMK